MSRLAPRFPTNLGVRGSHDGTEIRRGEEEGEGTEEEILQMGLSFYFFENLFFPMSENTLELSVMENGPQSQAKQKLGRTPFSFLR